MAITDPWVAGWLHPSDLAVYAVEGVLALAVVAAGWLLVRRRV
jgi:MYXO-CTERM domain-containing protein